MARRAGVWVLGGAAAATGVLLAAPDAYAWLRSRTGLGAARTETDVAPLPPREQADEATFDTRAARLSLRARLHESLDDEAPAASTAERPLAARPRPARAQAQAEPMRKAVDEARTRMLDNARKATRENGPAA